MKKVIQIVLGIVILLLVYVLYNQFATPINFEKEVKMREAAVITRIKDIRTAQEAYKQKYQRFTPSFDSLIDFILHDSLTVSRIIGSKDDSVAVAKGLVKEEKFMVAVKDTIYNNAGHPMTEDNIRELALIPYGGGSEYIMDAGNFTTESQVVVPVFECKAPYKLFLGKLNEQELLNLIDDSRVMDKYPGIKVGAMDQATNNAGNWE